MTRTMVAAVLAMCVAVGAGIGAGYWLAPDPIEPQSTAEFQDMAADMAAAEEEAADARDETAQAEEEAADARDETAQAEEAVAARMTELDEREQEIEQGLRDARRRVLRIADQVDQKALAVERQERELQRQQQLVAQRTFGGDGIYVVGEDVESGEYASAGKSGCYYAFLEGTSASSEIIDNNLTDGPARATLAVGDVFETSGCADWTQL